MNDAYVQKLIRLINTEVITIEDIKDPIYKLEVQGRLTAE
ncbi:MAG: hypothetical protein K0Q99_2066 [Clostridia bacterium]|jgi:hypothetical protein|nr:hypothetical protein [Clostridia bacterium]